MIETTIVTKKQFESAKSAIESLLKCASDSATQTGHYMVGSLSDQEAKSSPQNKAPIFNAMSISDLMIDYSHEHLSAFLKIVNEPIEPFASLTCLRSMLECCARSVWMLDARIGVPERIKRVFDYRFSGLNEQKRVLESQGVATNLIDKRICELRADAVSHSVHEVESMPGPTALIRDNLNLETMYRILSGVNHGHVWALLELGYDPSRVFAPSEPSGVSISAIKKDIKPITLLFFSLHASLAFSRAIWGKQLYCGVDSLTMEESLENIFDAFNASTAVRFWRSE